MPDRDGQRTYEEGERLLVLGDLLFGQRVSLHNNVVSKISIKAVFEIAFSRMFVTGLPRKLEGHDRGGDTHTMM